MNELPFRGGPAPPPAHGRIERFLPLGLTYRVQLQESIRVMDVHIVGGEKTRPCLAGPDGKRPCPFCGNLGWRKGEEGYACGLVYDQKKKLWEYAVCILTIGAVKQIAKFVGFESEKPMRLKPHAGLTFVMKRVAQGTIKRPIVSKMEHVELRGVPFDINPHLRAMWGLPFEATPESLIPSPVPHFEPAPLSEQPAKVLLSDEEYSSLIAKLQKGGFASSAARLAEEYAQAKQERTERHTIDVEFVDQDVTVRCHTTEGSYPRPHQPLSEEEIAAAAAMREQFDRRRVLAGIGTLPADVNGHANGKPRPRKGGAA